jgi:lysylphosphatidylglycerol synthetase-like protein (DUF2156 family)
MADPFSPWDPQGLRPSGPGEGQGPDPDPIVRRVRLFFAMITVGLNPVAATGTNVPPEAWVFAAMALVLVAILALALRNLRPDRLLVAGKRALDEPDPRLRRPRAERARSMGFAGLAMGWSMQAIALAMLPVLTGLLLKLLHGLAWPLLAFSGLGVLAGTLFQRLIARAVRLAVDDPELRAAYGSN